MGGVVSSPPQDGEARDVPTSGDYHATISEEKAKPLDASDVDTPRGVSAKEEVKRLRALLHQHAKERTELTRGLLGDQFSLQKYFEKAFLKADVDASGSLTKEEFADLMKELNLDLSDGEIVLLQQLSDTNKDNSISLSEFCQHAPNFFKQLAELHEGSNDWMQFVDDDGKAYYYNKRTEISQWETPEGYVRAVNSIAAVEENKMAPDLREYIAAVFKHADADKSGELSHDEFWNCVQHSMNLNLSEEQFALLQERSDVDRDGSVRWQEFVLVAPDLVRQLHENDNEDNCWTEHVCEESGSSYFVNTKTGQSQWEKPEAFGSTGAEEQQQQEE